MATASKSSGKKVRGRTSSASKATARSKGTAKSRRGAKGKSATKKVSARSSTARKSTAKRSARKQSPVTRIKRVATTVLHQGATAAKQGVQVVERLVEGVKDRVTT